jgi:hypothetical protein
MLNITTYCLKNVSLGRFIQAAVSGVQGLIRISRYVTESNVFSWRLNAHNFIRIVCKFKELKMKITFTHIGITDRCIWSSFGTEKSHADWEDKNIAQNLLKKQYF